MEAFGKLQHRYFELLEQQSFDEKALDYGVLEEKKTFLEEMARAANSGIQVFDLHQKSHVFTSSNFARAFGLDEDKMRMEDTAYFNSLLDPSDLYTLTRVGIHSLEFHMSLPAAEKKDYLLQNEYVISPGPGEFTTVIERHQVLELDDRGNIWLALSIVAPSPDQSRTTGVKSQLIHAGSGQIQPVRIPDEEDHIVPLSGRESQVLNLIRSGLLSKEISDKLDISVHTVNTHRQNILRKLNANNTLEAIWKAASAGG